MNQDNAIDQPVSDAARGNQTTARRHFGIPWVPLICLILGCLMQATAHLWDHQYANLGCLVLAIISCIALWIRWMRQSETWWRALMPGVVALAAAILFSACFEFVRFTGELVPVFAWRFSRAATIPPLTQSASDNSAPSADHALSTDSDEHPWSQDVNAFPEFLGPGRTALLERREFSLDWQATPPQIAWQQPIGAGWSGFAISRDRAFTMEEREVAGKKQEWITCYSLINGALLWHHGYEAEHYHAFGGAGPRSTPTLFGDKLFAQGVTGILTCLNADDGSLVWQVNLFKLLGLEKEQAEGGVTWGRSGSPLYHDGLIVVPLGGTEARSESLIAFDASNGREVWRAGDRQVSYASPQFAVVAKIPQILSVNENNVSGHDPKSGRVLWEYRWDGKTNTGASASQAMPVGSNRVLLSKGYGGGSALLELQVNQDHVEPELLWHHSSLLKTKFTNAVVKHDHAFALSDGILECVDLESGTSAWKQPRRNRYGHGQVLGVEDVLLVISEAGELALVDLNTAEFHERAKLPVLTGTTWNTLALSQRCLLVRNSEMAACVILPPKK